VKLTGVVKLLIERLFEILTYDFLGLKSRIDRTKLKIPSLSIIGYQDFSLINNMGIVFWFIIIFIVSLLVSLMLYIFKEKVDKLPKDEKLSKSIKIFKNFSQSFYNYLSVHQVISLTSLTIYLWYEYVEKGCFELTCFISEKEVSSTKVVKGEVVIAIILIFG
jgi:hypothetical protein